MASEIWSLSSDRLRGPHALAIHEGTHRHPASTSANRSNNYRLVGLRQREAFALADYLPRPSLAGLKSSLSERQVRELQLGRLPSERCGMVGKLSSAMQFHLATIAQPNCALTWAIAVLS
jgi:hypothetical protein